MVNQLNLKESWIRDVIENQEYPLTKTEITTVLEEDVDPDLPEGCWIKEELDLDRETYTSVEEAWEAVRKNFVFEVELPDLPDGVGRSS
jgi:hypothetical protein